MTSPTPHGWAGGNQQPRPISSAAKGGKAGGAALLMGAGDDYVSGLRGEGAGREPERMKRSWISGRFFQMGAAVQARRREGKQG